MLVVNPVHTRALAVADRIRAGKSMDRQDPPVLTYSSGIFNNNMEILRTALELWMHIEPLNSSCIHITDDVASRHTRQVITSASRGLITPTTVGTH